MKKPTITCTTPYGTFTRKTWTAYTHLLVIVSDKNAWELSWHVSEAQAQQARAQHPTPDSIYIFPVDQQALPFNGGPETR